MRLLVLLVAAMPFAANADTITPSVTAKPAFPSTAAQMPASGQPKTRAQLEAEAAAAGASKCRQAPVFVADPRLKESPAHRLADEPNAALVAAVMRSEGGCPKPVVLRENIGNQTDRLAPEIYGSARPYAIPRGPGQ